MSDTPSTADIRKALRSFLPLKLSGGAPRELGEAAERVLEVCLEDLGQQSMREGLVFCLRELLGNAAKANGKRVYFRQRGLEIANPADYRNGMPEFREEVLSNAERYFGRAETLGYRVEVSIRPRSDGIELAVSNNAEMVSEERERVLARIARSRALLGAEEVVGSVLDSTEGAGLGLTLVVLYLRKLGLPEEAFDVQSSGGLTTAHLAIPFSQVHREGLQEVSRRIAEEIEDLPTFPEHIVELQKLLTDPDVSFTAIARLVSRDPAFTADLLRYVNSAHFVLARRVENLADALRIAGLRFLRNMLYSYGTEKVLSDRYPEMRGLWAHSRQVAFYSHHLAWNALKDRQLADDVYVAGLLHDMGKIIVTYLYPRMRESLEELARARGVPQRLLEAISFGATHGAIGARVAQKWNFPAVFVHGIGFHHEPAKGPGEHEAAISAVYLANTLAIFEQEQMRFDQVDSRVLARFGIDTEEKLSRAREELARAYAAASTE